MSASIILKNLRVPTVIGVYDREKTSPQVLKLDLELSLQNAGASLSDRLRDTVDYDTLIADVRRFGQTRQHELLESFTYQLAQHLLKSFPLKHVQITAWKDIAVHAPTDIAVRVNMAAGEQWHISGRPADEDRFND